MKKIFTFFIFFASSNALSENSYKGLTIINSNTIRFEFENKLDSNQIKKENYLNSIQFSLNEIKCKDSQITNLNNNLFYKIFVYPSSENETKIKFYKKILEKDKNEIVFKIHENELIFYLEKNLAFSDLPQDKLKEIESEKKIKKFNKNDKKLYSVLTQYILRVFIFLIIFITFSLVLIKNRKNLKLFLENFIYKNKKFNKFKVLDSFFLKKNIEIKIVKVVNHCFILGVTQSNISLIAKVEEKDLGLGQFSDFLDLEEKKEINQDHPKKILGIRNLIKNRIEGLKEL